ncbi:FAD-dependent oxidoreductase [Nonomuraea jabiensis]|uniref:2-polyprenyl-6-methoxyphenol hydroxylase-like FAD-dependent oxidoreductase n=1 Tax=Nonomuraea jabiensis TaxID=882448 RepID=A0A7W9LB38_9ACTN|nr:NAD(P)/FAD-dependent oxidoreductase [Nonomuraea jabiensis]MBB5777266.1 2-polyprenyl-6-methoxyphenol hydroxylase-like FAD-dependent oxidoreductase [Nonomuraea jabiensis]
MHVIVIGAGLGGLCLAQGLRRKNIGVTVYESDDALTSRQQGYRIHIDEHGDRALAANLPERLHRLFRATAGLPRTSTPVFDHRLERLTVLEPSDGGVHLAVDRLTLRRILLSGLTDAVRFGKRFTHYRAGAGDRVTAYFADGSTATGDVLVAADGVNSPVRGQYLPHARVVDTGLRQLYGKVPLTARTRELFLDDMFAVFTPIIGPDGSFVGVAPVEFPEPVPAEWGVTQDYMTCSFGARRELLPPDDELRAMPGTELRALTLRAIEDWHPRVRAIVEHWDTSTVFALVLRTSVPIEPWPTTNVTLLGDAIHAMSPAGGVGANTALRDASALAAALGAAATGRPLLQALAGYESAMIAYGFAAVRASAENGHRLLGQDPLPAA